MPTPAERRALLFVAAVAALGIAVRGGRALRRADAPATDREALAAQIAAVDSLIARGEPRRPPRPRRAAVVPAVPAAPVAPKPRVAPPKAAVPAGPIDLDLAAAAELERLPGIGPALAARIVAYRDSAGPFGSLEAVQRVKGIGPALAARIAPHVTFSGRTHP